MGIILRIAVTTATVFFLAQYMAGISVASWKTALLVAVMLGILSVTVRPILYLITLPVNLITFGLFAYVLNALMVMLAVHRFQFLRCRFFTCASLRVCYHVCAVTARI